MGGENKVSLSTRVSPRTRRLAETAAELRGVTLSRFAAEVIEEAARRELALTEDEP